MNDGNVTQKTETVWRRIEESVRWFGTEMDGRIWFAVLIPVLLAGLFYVVWMYIRDSKAVGWYWATFLAVLRCTVYALLAVVFLLPARQTYDVVNSQSKVLLLFDPTGSMLERDDPPPEGMKPESMPTRLEKVVRLVTDDKVNFVRRILETNPVTAYRFGAFLDEDYRTIDGGKFWTRDQWEKRSKAKEAEKANQDKVSAVVEELPVGVDFTPALLASWLQPDPKADPENPTDEQVRAKQRYERMIRATNIGDSMLAMLNREINNRLQGIVVFTDGRSNQGESQAYKDLAERAKKAKIPIFVVAVGEDRAKTKIDITEVRAPDKARPDDPFKVKVLATGIGLPDREVKVFLDVYKPGPDQKEQTKDKFTTLEKTVTFKPGQPPNTEAEFDIDPAQFGEAAEKTDKPGEKESAKQELAEGDWTFISRIPADKKETVGEHVSNKAKVPIVKRPLRVLLFASAATRDFQFVNNMLLREVAKKRVEMSIYVQPAPGRPEVRTGVVLGSEATPLLRGFPDAFTDPSEVKDAEQAPYNLGAYDLIIGFDPDWTALSEDQIKKVEKWVQNGGGMIAVAGAINTLELSRPSGKGGADRRKLKPILDIYPVVLEDARVLQLERDTTTPYPLSFPGATPDLEFLRLDEDEKAPQLAGWDEFFHGKGGDPKVTIRGFYNFYPVKAAKNGAIVVATFADPAVRLKPDNKEMPYLVTMPYGSGRVVWLGSGEMWRLREISEGFNERFWTKLARYAGSGNLGRINQRISLNFSKTWKTSDYVYVEAKILGRDMQPLPMTAKPEVVITPPAGIDARALFGPSKGVFEMSPKKGGDWEGYFMARFLVNSPGEYKLKLKVPEINDEQVTTFQVEAADPEKDETRPDLALLYDLASDADLVLKRIDENSALAKELRQRLMKTRPVTEDAPKEEVRVEGKDKASPEKKEIAYDKDALKLVFDLKSAELIPNCMLLDAKKIENRGPVSDLWDDGFTMPQWNWLPQWMKSSADEEKPAKVSYVLVAVVGLLSIEWLTRKLLRLA
ncbi:MAG: VWA domain-containing protein [Gemmataceae bacterium]